ncbi:MAG: DUF3019 domain-containing protein [Pseudomonadales bacterium]|jgi:hypothetical protein|nr:DUF3019 domain-containing protein [Pseudomonadales bacterium]
MRRAARINKKLGYALLLCGSLGMNAGQAADVAGYTMNARPSICVSYHSEQPCTMATTVNWTAPQDSAVCLRNANDSETLHCWEAARGGSVALSYADTQDVTYQLVALDGTLLATCTIKVINRDVRTSRSRRRHVWSLL